MVFLETALTTFLGIHIPGCFPFCCLVDPYSASAGAGAAYYGPCGICCSASEAGTAPALCCIAWCCPGVAAGVAHDQLSQQILVDDDSQKELELEDKDGICCDNKILVPLKNIVSEQGRSESTHSLMDDLEGDEEENVKTESNSTFQVDAARSASPQSTEI
jgi:hypothetical protein